MIDATGRRGRAGRFGALTAGWMIALAGLCVLSAPPPAPAQDGEATPKPRKRLPVPGDLGKDHLKARSEAHFSSGICGQLCGLFFINSSKNVGVPVSNQ